ncbi:50S ribosomal protein L19 [candidate division WOR-3 bacterium JGI_Cruoil_03_51_56]|uniref:Large ribosomal subunit protein bL19 n=1 Tax=candidate division WOR-3 bacterium JGI_Cruoil_03_51_56 TaxID=1973747 RepID=A0A235BV16_UNCW3|nr:MAG: 50S ribosomal protein L19 [candidate division WOR-3 bacterium JGI_Cruoil_03_51_56]
MAKKKGTKKDKVTLKPAEIPPLGPGDIVSVQLRIIEGGKERIQTFTGTIIKIRGKEESKTFTVRKMSRGIGIERIFPFKSPVITKVEVKRHSKVRRAKLYYLRERKGRSAQLKEKRIERKPRPETV